MRAKEIENEVLKFIDDTVYNYAMLIDGEWGCGKTYFIKNELTQAIEDQYGEKGKVKYISLYGCKSVEDIQSKILWLFIEEIKKKTLDKSTKELAKTDLKKPKEKGIGDSFISSSAKLIGGFLKNKLSEISLPDVAWEWVDIKAHVFILDDLERCECKLNELFGFLNELVEHEGAKVILVANEKEITTELVPENLEQQYMISLSDKIEWPKHEEKSIWGFNRTSNVGKTKISFDELDERRKKLFPAIESNEDYKRMREKLIGVTIKYDPNIEEIVTALVEDSCYSLKHRKVLERNIEYFTIIMNRYNHHNLRTVQFFLSRITSVLAILSKMKIDPEYREKLEDYVTQECFRCSVEFKSDYHEKKDSALYNMDIVTDEPKLNTIKEYVESGELITELFKDDIRQTQSVYKAKIDPDDPYSKLYNGYYYMTQEEVEDTLDAMNKRLGQDKYPFQVYDKILILIARLQKIGFSEKYAKWIRTSMVKNIKEHDISGEIRVDKFYFEDDDEAFEIVTKLVQEINEEINSNTKTKRKKNLGEMVADANWVELLENYDARLREKGLRQLNLFAQVKSQKWVDAILRSSSREIHDFRKWMWRIYPQNIQVNSFEKDWKTLLAIHDAIRPDEESDLIKRHALELVIWQIEEIYKINTGEPFEKQ